MAKSATLSRSRRPEKPAVIRAASALLVVTAWSWNAGSAQAQEQCAPSTCGASTCDDRLKSDCDEGVWPGGVIPYQFASGVTDGQQDTIRRAMNDWQALTNNVITFQANATAVPRIEISWNDAGGTGAGFEGCSATPANCKSSMNAGNVYHELAHALGPPIHHFDRYDRRHYMRIHKTTNCDSFARCEGSLLSDFGPFDFKSTLLYFVTHPDHTVWDGSPLCLGATCGSVTACATGTPPVCPSGASCPSSTCTAGPGPACRTAQPQGFPTLLDASAVVERYRLQLGWQKFLRTVAEDMDGGKNQPFNYDLAPGVTMRISDGANGGLNPRPPATSSPAVETWGGNSLAIYVRGSNDRIYKKFRDVPNNTWSGWEDLGTPLGTGTTRDPAVVSWGAGRTDLVSRRGNMVSIRTFNNNSWGPWQSLGGPSSAAASAPALTSWGPDRLDVFVRGTDNQLYHKSCTANCNGSAGIWTSWMVRPGATFRGKPAAVSRGTGHLHVFIHGEDGKLYGINNDNDIWTDWYLVPTDTPGTLRWDPRCPDCSSPAAASRGNSNLDVFIRGWDEKLWATSWNGGSTWSSYLPLGGVLSSSPGTVTRMRGSDRVDLAAGMIESRNLCSVQHGIWTKHFSPPIQ